jgi:hypothetical protein
MSLIDDIKGDIRALDCSPNGLTKFGRTVGGVFLLIATAIYLFRHVTPTVIVFGAAGALLALAGMFFPRSLKQVYRVWMGMAFVIGWFVSRIVLALFFFLIITPVAIAARIAGKKFLNTEFKTGRSSYWIEKRSPSRYDRMS